MEIWFNEFPFLFLLAAGPGARTCGDIEYIYRPKELHISGDGWEYSVAFSW
jgi:hypothetical protein